eukprot:gnl/MRDRNA2_/MRDRNA2_33628_c0_seq1.p1 gnl/MRDRNA2_/MRDRNA2_33628_c0~~gnl/MRDRNA2_/MRDRNA2_33628_c0_seq1.p1  ORF type:complete len:152 (-),score=17.37 gnl/MRDRNA2_/MRDRNA2_33628_c0_seq1:48-503(-)
MEKGPRKLPISLHKCRNPYTDDWRVCPGKSTKPKDVVVGMSTKEHARSDWTYFAKGNSLVACQILKIPAGEVVTPRRRQRATVMLEKSAHSASSPALGIKHQSYDPYTKAHLCGNTYLAIPTGGYTMGGPKPNCEDSLTKHMVCFQRGSSS